ncbi:class II fructose-bisphosphate aldolase [Schaalia sp. Marseille-Q2122]|uniref:class II fructose-bisphosphate aldolase n=1 Tax=Schaalia sp. Marseille-Q2122 TaxID=2736604 RepID=UPI00158B9425|nr:class II fructose-bisphosphate aldolase [Schaalia sp. Marseille-Q2122]
MPIATPEVYNEMLNRARDGKFAYPAINVTSSQTLTAAIRGFAEAESDGILQVSVGGAEYWSGSTVRDRIAGSRAMAAYAREIADGYGITVALHTDHCSKENLPGWTEALMELEAEEVKAGRLPWFQSHMWDGSAISLDENLEIAKRLLDLAVRSKTILEIEVGAVGGEEDGVVGEINEKLYTTTADGIKTVEALGLGENGRYITALTFGNVHGAYKPGFVKLRPEILGTIQDEVAAHFGIDHRPFDLVMHGGSGSTDEEIALAVANGVIKMNVDTDTQYAYTRPVADWMLKNYDGVLKIDGEVGNKKTYDPRAWGKVAEAGMAARVVEACQRLGSVGTKMA